MKAKLRRLTVLAMVLATGLITQVSHAKLVALWDFEGNLHDSIGTNHGIAVGDANIIYDPERGNVLNLDGEGDYVDCGNASAFDINDAITVAAWVKGPFKAKKAHTIMAKGDNAWRLYFWSYYVLRFIGGGVTEEEPQGISLEMGESPGQWHHIVGVYDGTKVYAYVDGIMKASKDASGSITTNNQPLYIGENAGSRNRYWRGLIDDAAIFNHALNKTEITQLYTLGATSFIKGDYRSKLVEEAETIVKKQGLQKAIAFYENKIAESEQQKVTNPNDISLHSKPPSCELRFLLAKVKEIAGAPKDEVIAAYKQVIESGELSTSVQALTLLGLYENADAQVYEKTVWPLIQNNSDYLSGVTLKAKMMVRQQKSEAAIRFLQGNLEAYTHWHERHPYNEVVASDLIPEAYFQLAKIKEAVGASNKDIAQAYSKTFGPSHLDYIPERVTALIWLLDNGLINEHTEIIKSFTTSCDSREPFTNIVRCVCNHFESKKDWSKFEQFLDTLFANSKQPSDWAVFIESYLSDKTNRWAKDYSKYLDSKPRLKFGRDCIVAEKYLADGKFKKAAELYEDVVKRCGPTDNKGVFEFKLCECLFSEGEYLKAAFRLENFIANYKASPGDLVKEAMLMKGRIYVKLGELDKAIETFLGLMMEYPEMKNLPEVNFFVGYCYMMQDKFKDAVEVFDCLVKDHPDSPYASKARMCITRIKNTTER